MKNLTCCEKAYIRGLKDGGMAVSEIAKKVKRPEQTIYALFRRDRQPPSEEPKNPVGRQPKLSDRDIRAYVRYAKKNRRATLREITSSGRPDIGEGVVRRALHQAGYHNRVAKKEANPTH